MILRFNAKNPFAASESTADLISLIHNKPLLTLCLKFNPLGPDGVAEILNVFSDSVMERCISNDEFLSPR